MLVVLGIQIAKQILRAQANEVKCVWSLVAFKLNKVSTDVFFAKTPPPPWLHPRPPSPLPMAERASVRHVLVHDNRKVEEVDLTEAREVAYLAAWRVAWLPLASHLGAQKEVVEVRAARRGRSVDHVRCRVGDAASFGRVVGGDQAVVEQ